MTLGLGHKTIYQVIRSAGVQRFSTGIFSKLNYSDILLHLNRPTNWCYSSKIKTGLQTLPFESFRPILGSRKNKMMGSIWKIMCA